MNCLKNYIQIEGCVPPEYSGTPSGLYINKDLPSVTLEQIDKIADDEQETFLGVWDEIQDRALRKFAIVVKAGYRELFNSCSIDADWYCTNKEALALPWLYYLGAELMFERLFSNRINRYTTVDKDKAAKLKVEFENEFQTQLKAALEIINDGADVESGQIFSYHEVLP